MSVFKISAMQQATGIEKPLRLAQESETPSPSKNPRAKTAEHAKNSKEYAHYRKMIGSCALVGELLGVDYTVISRRCTGSYRVTKEHVYAIRYLAQRVGYDVDHFPEDRPLRTTEDS